jgi:hypothetical protein
MNPINRFRHLGVLSVVAVVAASGAVVQSKGRQLTFEYKKGKTYTYEMSMEMTSDNEMIPMDMKMTGDQVINIKSVKGKNAVVDVLVKNIETESTFESPVEGEEPQMEDQTMELTVNEYGKILKTESDEDFSLNSAGFLGVIYPSALIRNGYEWAEQMKFSEMADSMAGGMTGGLPEGIDMEMEWKDDEMRMIYKVESLNTKTAAISYTMSSSPTMIMNFSGMSMEMSMEIEGKGKFVARLSDGFPISSDMEMTNVMEMDLLPEPITQKMTMSSKLKK